MSEALTSFFKNEEMELKIILDILLTTIVTIVVILKVIHIIWSFLLLENPGLQPQKTTKILHLCDIIKVVPNAVKILLVKSISADRKHLALCCTILSILIITTILLLNFHINLLRRVPYTFSCSDRYAYLCELDY